MAYPPSHSQTVLPSDSLILDKIERTDDRFVLHAHIQQKVHCPGCNRESRYRHSEYERRLQDLPWQGCAVELRLKVRRFRCRNPACIRKVFAEPIPEVARAYARRTTRVGEIVRLIGYTAGGLPGSRILHRLALSVSDDTIIRAVKRCNSDSGEDLIRALGIDDWAWRKGDSYGTIFVDLDRHRVVDLLPDRSTDTVRSWLERHPAIQIVSRDRCGIYAEAARHGAAEALQVADRFHLLMNLSAAIERALEERSSELCLAAEAAPVVVESQPEPEKPRTLAEQRKQQRRDRRHQRYEQVLELYQQGYTQRAISVEMSIDRKTVRRWLRAGHFPERKPTSRKSHVRDFNDYLQKRWNDGCHNATRLFEEIRLRGYRGSRKMVSQHISSWRIRPRSRSTSIKKRRLDRVAPRHAAILACRPAERLSEQQKLLLDKVAVNCPTIRWMHNLAMDFREAISSKDKDGMLNWIWTAAHSGIGPVVRFAYGLRRDLGAVIAAVETPWSNGQVEGQINRLKAIKRQMYGRAGFRLLRARVLPYQAMAP